MFTDQLLISIALCMERCQKRFLPPVEMTLTGSRVISRKRSDREIFRQRPLSVIAVDGPDVVEQFHAPEHMLAGLFLKMG